MLTAAPACLLLGYGDSGDSDDDYDGGVDALKKRTGQGTLRLGIIAVAIVVVCST